VAGTRIPDQAASIPVANIAPVRVPVSNIPPAGTEKPGSPVVPNPQASNPQFPDIKQIVARLGLPQDTLNLSLLIFSRFLSVSPSPALIGSLRREILSSYKPPSGEKAASVAEANARLEARALAVLSAFDKGVSLAPEALERYARLFGIAIGEEAFSPFADCNPGGGNPRKQNENQENPGAPDAEEIRAAAAAIKDDLLDTLNRLPGKNGQYWTVFPFKINIKGIELKIFIRILNRVPLRSAHVVVDIAGPKRQWRCFLSSARGEGKNGRYRADISVYPEYPDLESLRKEAERFLGNRAGEFCFDDIRLRNGEEIPCWADDPGSLCLPSIDEEV
jgi:hypothetical protein